MRKTRKKEKGFTLIELLATIAILSLVIVVVYVFVADIFNTSKNNAKYLNFIYYANKKISIYFEIFYYLLVVFFFFNFFFSLSF